MPNRTAIFSTGWKWTQATGADTVTERQGGRLESRPYTYFFAAAMITSLAFSAIM
jgi:hypothetical protein